LRASVWVKTAANNLDRFQVSLRILDAGLAELSRVDGALHLPNTFDWEQLAVVAPVDAGGRHADILVTVDEAHNTSSTGRFDDVELVWGPPVPGSVSFDIHQINQALVGDASRGRGIARRITFQTAD
jgi:hypothetical protein